MKAASVLYVAAARSNRLVHLTWRTYTPLLPSSENSSSVMLISFEVSFLLFLLLFLFVCLLGGGEGVGGDRHSRSKNDIKYPRSA